MNTSSSNRLAIIVAIESEFALVEQIISNAKAIEGMESTLEGQIGDKEVLLMRCGIGKVNAAMRATEMLAAFSPHFVISTGVAGGIDASLQVGDLVIGTQYVYHDVWCGEGAWGQVQGLPERFDADNKLLQKIKSLHCEKSHLGLICTGDQFIEDLEKLQLIKKQFPDALAVDMESCAIAQVCYLKQTPFISLRIISDTPGRTSDHTAQYRDFWKQAPLRTFDVIRRCVEQL
jgi:adenosylhomocysteine nucleosidase